MLSMVRKTNTIELPLIEDHFSMIPFDLNTLKSLPEEFKGIVTTMLQNIKHSGGIAFFTIHGQKLLKGETLRRGAPHTDGNYDRNVLDWNQGGGSGWKVGENGPAIDSPEHHRLYCGETGGIIMASNFEACLGWIGEFDGIPGVGGDCRHIELNDPFTLDRNNVYYGNNNFIHESLPMSEDVHRVLARITLPINHVWLPN